MAVLARYLGLAGLKLLVLTMVREVDRKIDTPEEREMLAEDVASAVRAWVIAFLEKVHSKTKTVD